MRNKGQMFLIASVIIVIILIMLKTNASLPDIIQQKRELEGKFERELFANTVNELPKVIEISYYQPNNITNNVFDFGNFTRKKMNERLLDFELLFVGSMTPESSGDDTMNVTVINLLNKPISMTLRLNISSVTEMLPTYAKNLTKEVTDEVNVSDNKRAHEHCEGEGSGSCYTPYIYINFTTSETYDNVTIEGYYTAIWFGSGDDGSYFECWGGGGRGGGWTSLTSLLKDTEADRTGSLSGCDNSDGNYTFRARAYSEASSIAYIADIYIDYVFINRTDPIVRSSGMVDSSRWDTNYSVTQGNNYVLTVGYNATYEENVTIETKSNRSVYVGFFDITLIGSETTYKDKFQKSYTLP